MDGGAHLTGRASRNGFASSSGWRGREFGLRTVLVLTIALLALGTLVPVAAAETNGFGRCWLQEEHVASVWIPEADVYEPVVIYTVECAW